jgi:LPXTG-motif cell wall-anchored protein
VLLVEGVGTKQALGMADGSVRAVQQQSNEVGFIPDADSDLPFAVYGDRLTYDSWLTLAVLLLIAVGVFIGLRRRRARR